MQSDFKDIPFLEDLKFSGPTHVSLNLNGNLDSFKFEQQADLTGAGYHVLSFLEKKPNVLSKIKTKGSFLKNGGLTIDKWSYELGENKIAGSARIPDLDNPKFTVSLEANNFQVNTAQQFFRTF